MEFGCAIAEHTPGEQHWWSCRRRTSRERRASAARVLNQILEARAVELFRFVYRELARVGMDRALMGGVFLTGGGAKLPDLCDVAERDAGVPGPYGCRSGFRTGRRRLTIRNGARRRAWRCTRRS